MIKNSEQKYHLLSGYSLQKRLKSVSSKKPPLAAIQAEIRRGIDSIRSLMTPVEDPAIVFASAQLISPVSRDGCSCLPSASQTCSIGERSGDLAGHEIAPHTVTPCEIAVCRSTINAGSDRWPVRLQTRAVVISTETESGFITEDDTSPVCHTCCLRSAKIQSTLPMMRGQW
ncbi:hypothetical protein TNCV_2690501 [Trichonephila clavipes]|uniref:Uncharacterized protein n=1 Tax=Trichonephila clavipes TaxID=2585209 RepID=A0A8X7BBM6_TRICX|nr:hypothetical protein TNCV_2690501 [Trichonephila clavipes]